MGENEVQWTKSFAQPRINHYRSIEDVETPDEYLHLLYKYSQIAPYLVPQNCSSACMKTLSHHDLHLDNVFVDPETKKLTHIIDWQGTSTSALYQQRFFPRMIDKAISRNPGMKSNPLPSTSVDETIDTNLLSRYQEFSRSANPAKWLAWENWRSDLLTKPTELVSGAWERDDIFSFRHALINLTAHWPQVCSIDCPIDFGEQELEAHRAEMELLHGLGTILHELNDECLIPLGGMVPSENFEAVQKTNMHFMELFVDLAEDEAQKALHAKLWPYQDK